MITFTPLGGAHEIGANAYYLNIDGTGILLDCGMHPKNKGVKAVPDFEYLNHQPLDYVIISHAHSDHIGSLPYLIQQFPHVKILMTVQTREIASITLHNTVNILKETFTDTFGIQPYTHEEIDLLVRSVIDYNYGVSFEIKGLLHNSETSIQVIFYDAGHILGSAGILIEYGHERMFYTGDTRKNKQVILNGADYPEHRITTLIMESTYGAVDSGTLNSWKDEFKEFCSKANKILEAGGSILIPVFALGKTQEILAGITDLLRRGKLNDCTIYSGGIGPKISNVYDSNRYLVKRNSKELELKDLPQINLYDITNTNDFFRKPGIVLAPGGMLDEKTFAYKIVRDFLRSKNSAIFLVGYIDPESPGASLLDAAKGDKIKLISEEVPIEVKCKIEKFHFPSHSSKEELLELVDKLKPEKVILLHGDEAAISNLGYNILQKFNGVKLYSAELGKTIIIDEE
jgi:Cft2 family RNA processing exonuclease